MAYNIVSVQYKYNSITTSKMEPQIAWIAENYMGELHRTSQLLWIQAADHCGIGVESKMHWHVDSYLLVWPIPGNNLKID